MNNTNSSQDEDGKFFFNLNLGHRNYLFFEHPHHNATYRDYLFLWFVRAPACQGAAGVDHGVGAGAEHAGVLCPQLLEDGEERGQDRPLLRHGRAAQVPPPPSLLLRNVMLLELSTNLREVS